MGSALSFQPPSVVYPSIRVPNPDGSVTFKPGRAVELGDHIGTKEAATILGMSQRWINQQCSLGTFPSAFQPGRSPGASWRISRHEVLAYLQAAKAEAGL